MPSDKWSDLILSVDIGTSATKAILFDTDIEQVAIVKRPYPIYAPHNGWSEQDPEIVFGAVMMTLQEIAQSIPENRRVLGVVFSSQLYSVLAIDADGKALTSSLTWSDTRSAQIAQLIRRHPEAQGIYHRTGCPIDAIYPLAKIQWLRENVELPENVKFTSIKEYVIFRLIGQYVADWSIASATGLFDFKKRSWDETALSLLGVTPANLSELVPPRQIFTEWNKEIIDQIGFLAGTPLIIGAGDGPLASIGIGAYGSDTLAINAGTSAAARLILSEAKVDPEGRLWTYVLDEDMWVIGGMVSSGGIVYDWALRNFFSGMDETGNDGQAERIHEYADRLASAVAPGAENLICIPYLGGEQCPNWESHTRGGFFGLDFRHDRGHFIRAVLEGITRSIYKISESIQSMLNCQFKEIRVAGGLTSSPLWLQIAADMFGTPIVVPESVEGSARGAAMLAMVSLGLSSSLKDFTDLGVAQKRVHPREEVHAYYEKQYRAFQELLDCVRNLRTDD